ncbi:MAG: CocE/NonD family hydrolase [Planctomycetota bacterium]
MNSPISLWFAGLCLALAPSLAAQDVAGDWAGWMYLDDGDVPVRFHFARAGEELRVKIDLPVAGSTGVALGYAALEGERLVVAHPSKEDAQIHFALDLTGGSRLCGEVTWYGVDGRAELQRAAGMLLWEAPKEIADLVGVYGDPGAGALAVRAQGWGELVLLDPERGDERTLFARPGGGYVVGPGLYVPAPIERELRFERDASGAVLALVDGDRRLERREVRTEQITVERDGATLAGTLTLPAGENAACLVLAGGSDWRNRRGLETQRLLLAALGVASIAYDKRGFGESGGQRTVPFATTAADLRAFAELARAHPACDGERGGYLAGRRGGWSGAVAAAEDPACACFVSFVGPAVSPIEQETTARLDRMLERGATEAELALGERYLRALWEFARGASDGNSYLALRREVAGAGWLDELQGPDDLDDESWRWTRLNGDFDQRATLRSLDCPTLALFGELDLAVAARIHAPLMRDALWFAGVDPAKVLVLTGCDHSLRVVERDPDGQRMPFHRSPGRHPEAWSSIAAFVQAR